jgi:hypothetical protein
MPTRRFKRIALAQLLLSGCAVMFGVCVLIEHAQAQPGYVPPPTPLPPPVLNPSNPGTVPLHADHAFNAKHNAFNAKHRSKW